LLALYGADHYGRGCSAVSQAAAAGRVCALTGGEWCTAAVCADLYAAAHQQAGIDGPLPQQPPLQRYSVGNHGRADRAYGGMGGDQLSAPGARRAVVQPSVRAAPPAW